MVLNRNKYDAAYFGDVIESNGTRHVAGYTDYLELENNWKTRRQIVRFLARHAIPLNAKVLELGCGNGFMKLVATEQGYTDWTAVDWSAWCKLHEVAPIIEEDGVVFMDAQPADTYDYIISRAVLECIPDNQLQATSVAILRVGKPGGQRIHTTFLETGEPSFYNVRTLPEWGALLIADPNLTLEDYNEDD